MSSSLPTIPVYGTFNVAAVAPSTTAIEKLSDKQIEGCIAAVDAIQIEAIAKKIIAKVMQQLNIDVEYGEVKGEYNTDIITGKQFPVCFDLYDPDSSVMKALLPKVVDVITASFSTPPQFLEDGLRLTFNNSKKQGFLDLIDDNPVLSSRINQAIQTRISKLSNLGVSSLSIEMFLTINKNYTDENSGLYFSIDTLLNGACMGNSGGSLKILQDHALKFIAS